MKHTLSALILSALCAGAAAQSPAPRPTVKVGEVGIYDFHLRADNQRRELTTTVTLVDGNQIRTRIQQPGASTPEVEAVYDAEWNAMVSATGSRLEPVQRLLAFPLEAGKSWKSSFQITGADGGRSRGDSDVTVVGFEKVRTPAGEFDAWKVQAKGWINGVSWQGSFPITQSIWYAPALNRIVRIETKEGRRGGADNLTELKAFRAAP